MKDKVKEVDQKGEQQQQKTNPKWWKIGKKITGMVWIIDVSGENRETRGEEVTKEVIQENFLEL